MIKLKNWKKTGYFPKNISETQSKDTGMAMVLICLLIAYFSQSSQFVTLSILLLIVDMTVPNIYRPLAKIWIGITHILGTIVSKLLLTIIFFTLVTPVGVTRRIFGADSLQLKKWKKVTVSVFTIRDHHFQPEEIERPY